MVVWMKEGTPNHDIENESNFCDRTILDSVLKAKNIFDELNLFELCHARTKANPFETIKSVFFMNRAALKMANIDAATEFMFSNIDQNTYHNTNLGPYYFADVCAGPGGFSEYILWRKKWHFKGFGLTLRDENNFRLQDSMCASPVTFQALYGKRGDGNVCCPENIEDFKTKVLHETDGKGVHFMMSDGGFSVEGNENIQEILSKDIYICQCLVALEIIRTHGHFVTKLFDVFTSFSVGLLYLMYKCFEKVTILKPNSSRPANSERYFICYSLKEEQVVQDIKEYLRTVVKRLWELKDNSEKDVLEIVPLEIIKTDENFFSYIVDSNNSLGQRQTYGLEKLAAFCRNTSLVETRQEELRKKCLEFWDIPNLSKIPRPQLTADQLLNLSVDKPEVYQAQPKEINDLSNFNSTFTNVDDWHYCLMYGSRKYNNCCIYAAVGASKVYRLQRKRWVKVKNLQLVKGTLLYGELVKEWNIFRKDISVDPDAQSYKQSLHVVDALRLGDTNMSNLKFKERMELLQVYCKSVTKESTPSSVRIRPKVMSPLSSLLSQPPLKENRQTGSYISTLPVMGYNTFSEVFDVNSLLLLKTNDNQFFHSSYVLRVQIFINSKGEQNEHKCLSLKDVMAQLKET
ncbi:cap-specific mRNA (nucleoside-2'-O-)-methyltransferase 1 isoform X2 [Anoplophora glabripennis]|nr:cap-specific mRNA (nucleoside-2'-O-)-methyltransferase 1 isoform X2 [Anoplophora glabripennis]XP_018567760.1 cap-specific mRNA (nucleoside-2'-O-)-methyltransferase 1 isoform X2 [Anoplophora glabripennis]